MRQKMLLAGLLTTAIQPSNTLHGCRLEVEASMRVTPIVSHPSSPKPFTRGHMSLPCTNMHALTEKQPP